MYDLEKLLHSFKERFYFNDSKNSEIFYNLKQLSSILIYFKMSFISTMAKLIFFLAAITAVFSVARSFRYYYADFIS